MNRKLKKLLARFVGKVQNNEDNIIALESPKENIKRGIINYPPKMYETVEPKGLIEKWRQRKNKVMTVKAWYYINRGTPEQERKEWFHTFPSEGKMLFYMEKDTPNSFAVHKTADECKVYSIAEGRKYLMKSLPGTTTNQEVKDYLTG